MHCAPVAGPLCLLHLPACFCSVIPGCIARGGRQRGQCSSSSGWWGSGGGGRQQGEGQLQVQRQPQPTGQQLNTVSSDSNQRMPTNSTNKARKRQAGLALTGGSRRCLCTRQLKSLQPSITAPILFLTAQENQSGVNDGAHSWKHGSHCYLHSSQCLQWLFSSTQKGA